jgi:hypothetical protein
MTKSKTPWKVGAILPASEVPTWARRPLKYKDLIEQIAQLKPGQTLPVTFASMEAARQARNSIRDQMNKESALKIIDGIVTTRLIEDKSLVYFTMNPKEKVSGKSGEQNSARSKE